MESETVKIAQAYSTPLSPGIVTLVIDNQFFNLPTEMATSLLHQIGNATSNARTWTR